MRLAEDDRARVPFALVAVILLVGSASYSATLAHRPTSDSRPDEVAAMNRVDGGIATAVHRGTKRAANAAAGAPVLVPANTSGGSVINESEPFRDYLRIRIYLAVREDLETTSVTVGEARAVPSLSSTPTAAALRAAKRRVHLTRVDGGLEVRIENVSVRLERNGRVVDRRNRTVTRTVATPVLAVHERVQRYERRLNRGPTEGPGLGRRLTGRLNAIGWTRGYAQYGGAPISNVIANRHVELMANGALLSTQRTVFGRSDPAGRRATARATAIVGGTDALVAAQNSVDTVRAVPKKPGHPTGPAPPKLPEPTRPPSAAEGNVTVGVNLTADHAFSRFVSGSGEPTLETVVSDVYGADVKPVGKVEPVTSSFDPPRRPRGEHWTLDKEWRHRTVTVHSRTGDGQSVSVDDGWHRLRADGRRVHVTETIVQRWVRDVGKQRQIKVTEGVQSGTYDVTVALHGRHAVTPYAPDRDITLVHERGGPLDGPNLRGVESAGRERIEQRDGSIDEIARSIVEGELDQEPVRIDGERPDDLEDWLYADLAALRDRVRNVSVTVPRTRLGAGDVNPAAVLAERLRDRRKTLVDAPSTYGSVAEKARIAARNAYLAAVIARLDARASRARATRSRFDEVLSEHDVDPGTLSSSLELGARTDLPPANPVVTGGPLGSMNASVTAAPAYLTLSGVTHERLPALTPGERYHPLVARNTNLFTVPYGDAADTVTESLFGNTDRTSLRTAARTLRSANRTLERRHEPSLAHRRNQLRSSVAESLGFVRTQLRATLRTSTDLTAPERAAALRQGFRRWDTTAGRAIAAANGSLANAVAAAAAERADQDTVRNGDWLAVRLRVTLAGAREHDDGRPEQPTVNRSASATRAVTERVVEAAIARGANATAEAVRRELGDDIVLPPAGLPLAPVPGYWYVTTNVWSVSVRGAYVRFAVSVPAGAGGRNLTYERQRATVALDWDGDGEAEPIGRSTRVDFGVSTAVAVVVPPGGPGVGDRDGNADERSAGWPDPGNVTGE